MNRPSVDYWTGGLPLSTLGSSSKIGFGGRSHRRKRQFLEKTQCLEKLRKEKLGKPSEMPGGYLKLHKGAGGGGRGLSLRLLSKKRLLLK